MSHTPAPWINEGRVVYSPGEHGAMICEISEPRASTLVKHQPLTLGSPDSAEAYANARLIAAAPDLLTACKAVLAHETFSLHIGNLLVEAVTKAEGHEPSGTTP